MEPVTTLVWVCAPSLSQASSSTSLRVVTLALGVPREKESAPRARGDSNAASSRRAGLVPSGGGCRDAGGRKRGTHLNELHIVAVLHPGSRITDEAEVRCQHRRTDTRAQGEAPAKGRGEGPTPCRTMPTHSHAANARVKELQLCRCIIQEGGWIALNQRMGGP